MASLTIGWEYLTGYSVATDPTDRSRAEWPPHPGRVFLAMAAAWFETHPEADATEEEVRFYEAEGRGLRWLETLADPQLVLPSGVSTSERTATTAYVPVNDGAGPSSATLQSVPALTRNKQARMFPRRYVGDAPSFLHWPTAVDVDSHRAAISRVCGKVTRLGHSSSLVSMWVAETYPSENNDIETWHPDGVQADRYLRKYSVGLLDALPTQTQIPRIERFAELVWHIEDAEQRVSVAKTSGNGSERKAASDVLKSRKEAYEREFGERFTKARAKSPPPLLRPKLGLWSGYHQNERSEAREVRGHSHFDTDLLVLTHVDGPRLPVVSSLPVTAALRGAVMQQSGIQPVPPWVSGHRSDGSPNQDDGGHLAFVPLPFVGQRHADGRLLGIGLAFPRDVDRRQRGRVLGPLLVDESGQPKTVLLRLGKLGEWALQKREWSEPRKTLAPETWTGNPVGVKTWATVTPIVLDRYPKVDRLEEREAWESEVREILAQACVRIGLPRPVHVDVDTTSWHRGSPRAIGKRRPLPHAGRSQRHDAALGDGFPPYPARGTNAPRPQVHAFLEFADPILGPVLLGAGRYRGYGVLMPYEVGG